MKRLKETLFFAFPILLGQLGHSLIGVGDLWVAGRISSDAVSAMGISLGFIYPVMWMFLGLVFSVGPKISEIRGAGLGTRRYEGLVITYGFFVGLALAPVLWAVHWVVPFLDFDPKIVPMIEQYICVTAIQAPFFSVFSALREFYQAQGNSRFPNMIYVLAVGANVLIAYLFVFPMEMGFDGLAWAAFVVRVLMCAALITPGLYFRKTWVKSRDLVRGLLSMGWPIGLGIFFEVAAFAFVSIIAGRLGVKVSAASNIILNLVGTTFMVPLSFNMAAAVKVGHARGERNREHLLEYIKAILLLGLISQTLSATVFLLFGKQIFQFFTADQAVISIGLPILVVATLFQWVDGAQVILVGILRGFGRTRVPSLVMLFGYWTLALPFGYWLAYPKGMGALGLWIGLAVGLTIVAFVLGFYLRHVWRRSAVEG
jgi:multidrug resistance protein, MATE family